MEALLLMRYPKSVRVFLMFCRLEQTSSGVFGEDCARTLIAIFGAAAAYSKCH